jgi:hypothetical protein
MPFRPFRFSSASGATTSPHESYSITCVCGQVVEGERTDHSLQIACPVCATLLYVLPRDVYPTPRIIEPPPVESPAKMITFAAADEPSSLEAPSPPKEDLLEIEIEDDNQRLAEPIDPTPRRIWIERPSGKVIRKQLLRVTLALAVIGLLTAWGISRREGYREAERAFQRHHERAISFADEGLWDEAFEEATQGLDAARRLNKQDSSSRELLALEQELEVLRLLSSLTPIEIVLEKQNEEFTREDWIRQFRLRHSQSWMILDATVLREEIKEPDPPPKSRKQDRSSSVTTYHLDYPIGLEGEDVRFVFSRTPDWLVNLPFEDQRARVLIAAKLDHVRFPDKDSDAWEIVLSGEESRPWTNAQMLDRALGVISIADSHRELNELIQAQRARMLKTEAKP